MVNSFGRILLAGVVLYAVTASAGENRWESIGPDAGVFENLHWSLSDSDVVWGVSNDVAYRSVDGGATWEVVGATPESGWITDFTVDPEDDSRIFIANAGSEMYVLDSNGDTEFFEYSEESARGQKIAASGSRIYVGGQGTGVWVSTDGGATWSNSSNGLPENGSFYEWIHTIAASPAEPLVSWVSVWSDGVYTTVDGGATWTKAEGLPLTSYQLEPHPTDSATVLAATSSGVYKSTDSGLNWSAANTGIWDEVISVAYSSPDGQRAYAVTREGEIFQSDDGAETWTQLSTNIETNEFSNVAAHPATGNVIAVAPEGNFLSNDGGSTWRLVEGVQSVSVSSVVQSHSDQDTLYLANRQAGVYATTDKGESWRLERNGLPHIPGSNPGYQAGPLAVNETSDSLLMGAHAIHQYSSAASEWTQLPGSESRSIRSIVVNPGDSDHIIAGFDALNADAKGIMVTRDGGENWSYPLALSGEMVSSLAFDPSNTETVYAGLSGSALWRSDDGGASWVAVADATGYGEVSTIAVDPSNSDILYVGFSGNTQSLLKTTNGGESWEHARSGITGNSVEEIAINSEKPYVLLATSKTGGVYRSVDSGASWQAMNDGLIHDIPGAEQLILDKADTSRVFASFDGMGLSSYTVMPDLKVELPIIDNLEAGDTATLGILVGTQSEQAATGVSLLVTLQEGLELVSNDSRCTVEDQEATCEVDTVGFGGDEFAIGIRAEDGGQYQVTAEISADEADPAVDNNTATREYTFRDDSDGGGGGGSGGGDDSGGDDDSDDGGSSGGGSGGGCSLGGTGGAGGLQLLLLIAFAGLIGRRRRGNTQAYVLTLLLGQTRARSANRG